MNCELIETGIIVNTHGIRGEVRVQPWADSPEMLIGISYFYIDDAPIKVNSAKVHKNNIIASLEGVDNLEAAIRLKNKVVKVAKTDIKLDEGKFFVADLIGLKAIDADTEETLGEIADVLSLPANNVYVIKGEREILVPAVAEFIAETNLAEGYIRFRMIEGL